jgi:peptidoglycan/xylan/chitin deacetylase (PgdA/CDA1 family)
MLCVSPHNFAEHLEVIRKHNLRISFQKLYEAIQEQQLPRRSVTITFDDGYADNLHKAKPLLERYDVPATIFISTGTVCRDREFWSDELERILLQPGTLPKTLSLKIGGNSHCWQLGDAAHYSDEEYRRHLRWSAWDRETPTPRHDLYRALDKLMQPLLLEEQQDVLDALLALSGAEPKYRQSHRFLSPEEVVILAEDGLVEIGAHTVTHPMLAALPPSLQQTEIEQSKLKLEEITARSVTRFAYPYGADTHYTADTVSIVRNAGFTAACSASSGIVRRGADLFQLPRMYVHDWSGEEFEERLSNGFYC